MPKVHKGLIDSIRDRSGWDRRTTNRGTHSTPTLYCYCCGRAVKEGHNLYVCVDENSKEIVDYEDGLPASDYGLYEVGADCSRKYLAGVVLPRVLDL